jgi:hypothetical protein
MKRILSIGSICLITLFTISCADDIKDPGTHTHEDGSTHTDHDTTKPAQQEFTVGDSTHTDSTGKHKHADSTKKHTHADGKKHTH